MVAGSLPGGAVGWLPVRLPGGAVGWLPVRCLVEQVPWLLPAELFPADKVAVGSSFSAMCNWLANFVCGLIFLPLASTLGGACFVPFLVVLLPFALFVATIPETRGKSVQQILFELSGKI